MREYMTPATLELPGTGNLTDAVVANGRDHAGEVVCRRRTGEQWSDVTAARFLAEVRAVAKGLVAAGIDTGDRVAVLSKNRYEWTLLDYAIWFVGGVSVPLYETSSVEQLRHILTDSGTSAVIAETAEHRARIDKASALVDPSLVWVLEERGIAAITTIGAAVPDDTVERRRASLTPEALATLIYTSGTTGEPKGCMLTHANFMVELSAARAALPELFDRKDASTLVFLPLAHVFARVIAVGAVMSRVPLAHSSDVTSLARDLASVRPTFVLGVPRIFEKLFSTAAQQAAANGRGRLFDRAAHAAMAYSRSLDTGGPGLLLRARHAAYDRLVYRRIRESLGGDCEYAVSGGAQLGERLGHFYRGTGICVLEGYGLTETTAAATVNLPGMTKIGTVGRPLPGTSVQVHDGELLVRGGQVFSGYWNDERATRRVLDGEGWLHTGDLGEIDEEGFVWVLGRKRELIVTAGGKMVSPSALEDRVRAHFLVSQCLVVGDGKPFIAALVTLDPEACARWADQRGKAADPALLADDPALLAEIQAAVDSANQAVSWAESIRRFSVLPILWTEEDGHLTPSLKLRRELVMRQYRDDVEALYTG